VATEVDPEILLIDEILAVGDAAFQQKCLGRIDTFHRQGKTIFMVSHSAVNIRKFCQRALWIHDGVLRADGAADEVVRQYEELLQQPVEV
jgi:ABC-type polysaccharide/polyol phosphate transport system ATPase subunit